ncbi:hypothetical protein P3T18_004455 [Paraburkholderia sp. GAS199]
MLHAVANQFVYLRFRKRGLYQAYIALVMMAFNVPARRFEGCVTGFEGSESALRK